MSENCNVCGKEADLYLGGYEYCDPCYEQLEKNGARKEIVLKLQVWCPLPADHVGKMVLAAYQESIDKAGGEFMDIPTDDTWKKFTGVSLGKAELISAVEVRE